MANQNPTLDEENIRSVRLRRGLTFGELAERACVTEGQLRQIERGLIVPDGTTIAAIAGVLGVDSTKLAQAQAKCAAARISGEGYVTAKPGATFVNSRKGQLCDRIAVLDLFCGTGGFSHGFEQTGRFGVMAGIDLLPDRVATFHANHRTATAACGDVRTFSLDRLLDGVKPQVVIGGPPCQGFSSIRPFRALNNSDQRNNLFEQFALTVEAIRPDWFVMENVVGLLTHERGATLRAITGLFEQIGYTVSWSVLNAACYGLPQRRERLIIVGNRHRRPFRWPKPTHHVNGHRSMAGKRFGQRATGPTLFGDGDELLPATTVLDAIHDLPPLASGQSAAWYRDDVDLTPYEQELRGDETELTLHDATRHSSKMLEIIRHAGHNRAALPPGLTTSGFSSSYSRLEPDKPSVTLTVNFVHPASNKCIHPYQDRALTPREGARLQGFPDAFRFAGSRAQVVKQIGNAVPPLLGKVIATGLLNSDW